MSLTFRIGSPRATLVVAPHPDDETIGAFALILALRRRRLPVAVLVVADGAASHAASAAWPRGRLVRERYRETRRAMHQLGVAACEVYFLGLPDGNLSNCKNAEHVIGRAAMRLARNGMIVGPCRNDSHPDHRVVAAALTSARLPGIRRVSYQVWPAGMRTASSRSLPLRSDRSAKRRAVASYRTQTGLITDDPRGFAMSRREIAAFAGPREWYRESRR